MVDCLTDDRGRVAEQCATPSPSTAGNLGADGSVSYLFNTVGLMTYPPGTDEEHLMQVALEAGAEDVVPNADGSVEVLADPIEFDTVRAMITPAASRRRRRKSRSGRRPRCELSGRGGEQMVQLLEALEKLDDVQDVYSNVEISDEVLARV